MKRTRGVRRCFGGFFKYVLEWQNLTSLLIDDFDFVLPPTNPPPKVPRYIMSGSGYAGDCYRTTNSGGGYDYNAHRGGAHNSRSSPADQRGGSSGGHSSSIGDYERNWRNTGGGNDTVSSRRYSDDHGADSGDSYRSGSRYRDRSPRDRRSSERGYERSRRRHHRSSRESSRERSYSRGRNRSDSDSDNRYSSSSRDRYYDDRDRYRDSPPSSRRRWRDDSAEDDRSRSYDRKRDSDGYYHRSDRFASRVKDDWLAHVWGDGGRPSDGYGGMDYGDSGMEHYDRSSYKSQVPNKTLIIRGLGPYVTEKEIREEVIRAGGAPRDIRLIRKKDTGSSRGFAFVEFGSTEEAQGLVEKHDGEFRLKDQKVIMQYSIQRDFDKEISADWYCKCCALNFKRREFCYRCGSDRKSGECTDSEEGSSHPTHTVMLKGLDMLTTEENVLKAIQSLSSLPIRSVRIGRDKHTNVSRGICYLEMNNVSDAMYLHNTLLTQKMRIDGRSVYVSYCKNIPVAATVSSGSASNAGNAAIAAAQWSHQKNDGSGGARYSLHDVPRLAEYSASVYAKNTTEKDAFVKHYTDYYTKVINGGGSIPSLDGIGANPSSTGYDDASVTVSAPAVPASSPIEVSAPPMNVCSEPPSGNGDKCYPVPDVSTYQYDKTSGYYYDPYTTLYYDANSQYYFSSKINKFLYWDGARSTYLLAPDSQAPQQPGESAGSNKQGDDDKKKEKLDDKDKVKVAKRIAKDMEKWAKTLNQKKEIAKQNLVASQTVPTLKAQGAADIGYTVGVLGKSKDTSPSSMLSNYMSSMAAAQAASASDSSLVAEYGQGSDSEEDNEELQQDDKHVDWNKMACLLCKRQFPNKQTLLKHQQLSDLHQKNLEEWYRSIGISREDASRKSIQYRDRAKERRVKYNEPDVPPSNKLKENYMKAKEATVNYEQPNKYRIGGDNVGNKLLQKMGWQEGMGLGKSNQGRTEIIQAEARPMSAGLGIRTQGVTPAPGETYKDCVKKMMRSRYEEVDNR